MKPTKKLLINQPAGIGDILFIQKIVKKLSEDYEVYHPVKDSISWMTDYVDTTCKQSDCQAETFDVVVNLDGLELPNMSHMKAKYVALGINHEDFIDYIDIIRDKDKEDELFSKMIDQTPYRLVCPWYGTPETKNGGMLKMNIPHSEEYANVIMDIREGYTLFDWLKIIENAEEIHTTDSAIMFLIEKYKCKAKELVAYSRREDHSKVSFMFQKDWSYVVGEASMIPVDKITLSSVTLVGMDGAGNRPDIIKAMRHSMNSFSFGSCVLLSPMSAWSLYETDDRIRFQDIRKLTYQEWNEFVIKELHNHIFTEHYLFVDTDGFVLNSDKWDPTFLDYDYLGARWTLGQDIVYKNRLGINCDNTVGNGGFTLRSKRFLEEASKLDYDGHSPEDAFLCIKNYDTLLSKGMKFAPCELADKFSTDPYNGKSFGFHGNKTIINRI